MCILLGTTRRLAVLPKEELHLQVDGVPTAQVEKAKRLGVTPDGTLSWEQRVDATALKISMRLGLLRRLHTVPPQRTSHILYNSLVLPHCSYCCVVWGTACENTPKQIFITPAGPSGEDLDWCWTTQSCHTSVLSAAMAMVS